MVKLRDYQEKSVTELLIRFNRMLASSENEVCVFQAPTGSGKTIVVANLLKKFIKENYKYQISIIWIAPRKLHTQSKDRLEILNDDCLLKCSNFEDLLDIKISQNEILFFNWESINKKNNVYKLDNEECNTLSTVVQNTKKTNKLVLIIDESHHASKSEKSLEIINDLSPDITLEISATPHLKSVDETYKVRLKDVIDQEMIKNEISVNPEFSQTYTRSQNSDEFIIDKALQCRTLLKEAYEKVACDGKPPINPLMLIQIPDKSASINDKKNEIINILVNKGYEKNNIAIWLSDEKTNTLSNIEKNDNQIDILIFKQAISIGWDCPRASILVVFREYSNFRFTIQTVGRIMRMPELTHYADYPELNKGYVFTNLENINLAEEYVKEYISVYESYRNSTLYKPINLKSIYLKRERDRTRLSSKFVKIFNNNKMINTLKHKIDPIPKNIIKPILSDGIIKNIDQPGKIKIDQTVQINLSDEEVQRRFDNFCSMACSPYAPFDSSDRLKTALYQFLNVHFKIKKYSLDAQKIILDVKNYQLFLDSLNHAKELYKNQINTSLKNRDKEIIESWNVPKIMTFKTNCTKLNVSKAIMNPFYFVDFSEPEQRFIERLSISSKIIWWYKNGHSEKKYFSVPYYNENGYELAFYVDFIIQFNDGTIGLFDTKSGNTGVESSNKHNGLYEYIQSENKKNKKLLGGIIIEKNNTWRYYDKKSYHYDKNDLSDWKILDF